MNLLRSYEVRLESFRVKNAHLNCYFFHGVPIKRLAMLFEAWVERIAVLPCGGTQKLIEQHSPIRRHLMNEERYLIGRGNIYRYIEDYNEEL